MLVNVGYHFRLHGTLRYIRTVGLDLGDGPRLICWFAAA